MHFHYLRRLLETGDYCGHVCIEFVHDPLITNSNEETFSDIVSRYSEVLTEYLKNLWEIFPQYYMQNNICGKNKYLITQYCVTCHERVNLSYPSLFFLECLFYFISGCSKTSIPRTRWILLTFCLLIVLKNHKRAQNIYHDVFSYELAC